MTQKIKKTVLVSVMGSSPSVLTETLYALKDTRPFPSEIQIFTTSHGAQKFQEQNVTDAIKNLCLDYQLPTDLCQKENIIVKVVETPLGKLDDIRTAKEQEAMADFLTLAIKKLTRDDATAVHASIAGGRKSMSFYMGYIFSMFARPCDKLSHVLVTPEYEFTDFLYPTLYSKTVKQYDRESREWIPKLVNGLPLDAKNATVELAEIPFIRLNDSLTKFPFTSDHDVSYSKMVQAFQYSHTPETICVHVDTKQNKIRINGTPLGLNPDVYAYYRLILEGTKGLREQVSVLNIKELTEAWLRYIAGAKNPPLRLTLDEKAIDRVDEIMEGSVDTRTASAVENSGFDAVQHSKYKNRVQKSIMNEHVGNTVELCAVEVIDSQICHNGPFARNKTKLGVIGIRLHPDQIIID